MEAPSTRMRGRRLDQASSCKKGKSKLCLHDRDTDVREKEADTTQTRESPTIQV